MVSPALIARHYLSGWFIVDAIAILPVSLIEAWINGHDPGLHYYNAGYPDASQTKLARLARLPRIYRLMRVLRLAKMVKIAKSERAMANYLQSLDLSFGTARLL